LTQNWLAKPSTNYFKTAFFVYKILFLNDKKKFKEKSKKISLLPMWTQNTPSWLTNDHFAPTFQAPQARKITRGVAIGNCMPLAAK
jgi:hypothetical protein